MGVNGLFVELATRLPGRDGPACGAGNSFEKHESSAAELLARAPLFVPAADAWALQKWCRWFCWFRLNRIHAPHQVAGRALSPPALSSPVREKGPCQRGVDVAHGLHKGCVARLPAIFRGTPPAGTDPPAEGGDLR
jgi:hypothetical protein